MNDMVKMGTIKVIENPGIEEPNYEEEWDNTDVWTPPIPPTDGDGEWILGKYLTYPIEDLQDKYHHLVQGDLTDEVSIYRYQQDHIERAFVQFGLTKQEYAKAATEIAIQSTIGLNQIATSTALEMVKMTDERPVRWNNMYMQQQDIVMKHYQIAADKYKEATARDAWFKLNHEARQAEIQTHREYLVTEKMEADIALVYSQIAKNAKDAELINSRIALTEQQTEESKENVKTNASKTELTTAQKLLVDRQTTGYSDNLLVKAAEFQSNLASFASSSGSSSAQGAIINFNQTVSEIKGRV